MIFDGIMDDYYGIMDDYYGWFMMISWMHMNCTVASFHPQGTGREPWEPWSLVGSGDEELSEAIKELIRRMEEVLTRSAGCFRSPKIFQWKFQDIPWKIGLNNRPFLYGRYLHLLDPEMASEYRGISRIDKHGDARWDRMGCQVMTWVLTFWPENWWLTENLWPLNNEENDADKQYNLEI